MMQIKTSLAQLYDKDTRTAYANLQALEFLSEKENTLYPYLETFLAMAGNEKYVIRVRGIRLLCKQARWDADNKIDPAIEVILQAALHDEKPTAVRQALKALEEVVLHKPQLRGRIKERLLAADCSAYNKDTMRGLIKKDIEHLLARIDSLQQR